MFGISILRVYPNPHGIFFAAALEHINSLFFISTASLLVVFFASLYLAQTHNPNKKRFKLVVFYTNLTGYVLWLLNAIISGSLNSIYYFCYLDGIMFFSLLLFLTILVLNYGSKLAINLYEYSHYTSLTNQTMQDIDSNRNRRSGGVRNESEENNQGNRHNPVKKVYIYIYIYIARLCI